MSITLDGSTGISVTGNNNLSIGTLAAGNTTITGTLAANATTITGNVSVTGTQFINGTATFANSTGNTIFFVANGNVGISNSTPVTRMHVAGSITLDNDQAIRTGANNAWMIGSNSTMITIGSQAAGAGRAIGLYSNSTSTSTIYCAPTGDVMINTANNTAGGFANKLIVKQTSSSWVGGIGVEASSNDHVLTMGCNSTYSVLSSSYRTQSGYKPLAFEAGQVLSLVIDSAGRVTTPYQPAFHVTGLTATIYANTAGYITIWKTVDLNRGSHWNNSTGTFTAPIAGTYLFNFDPMYQHNGGDVTFQIYKNGAAVAYNNPHTKDNGGYFPPWHNAPISWVGDLSANDTIRFWWAAGGVTTTFIYPDGLYTRAWGYLLG